MQEKTKLLEAIAGRNRGLRATEMDRINILTAVEHLEDLNPNPQPLDNQSLLDGNWRLLYTTSRNLLGLDRFPLIDLGEIYQCIRTTEAKLYNIAEFVGLPFLDSLVVVVASFVPVSERRVEVKFERTIIGLQKIIGYRNPNQLIQDLELEKRFLAVDFGLPQRESLGWLEITYLDEDLRIGRGSEGSVFILAKDNYHG